MFLRYANSTQGQRHRHRHRHRHRDAETQGEELDIELKKSNRIARMVKINRIVLQP
jgi:hypothetical protein